MHICTLDTFKNARSVALSRVDRGQAPLHFSLRPTESSELYTYEWLRSCLFILDPGLFAQRYEPLIPGSTKNKQLPNTLCSCRALNLSALCRFDSTLLREKSLAAGHLHCWFFSLSFSLCVPYTSPVSSDERVMNFLLSISVCITPSLFIFLSLSLPSSLSLCLYLYLSLYLSVSIFLFLPLSLSLSLSLLSFVLSPGDSFKSRPGWSCRRTMC